MLMISLFIYCLPLLDPHLTDYSANHGISNSLSIQDTGL